MSFCHVSLCLCPLSPNHCPSPSLCLRIEKTVGAQKKETDGQSTTYGMSHHVLCFCQTETNKRGALYRRLKDEWQGEGNYSEEEVDDMTRSWTPQM